MELFLLLFVLGMWIYLSQPKPIPSKRDPWEELGKAIGTAVKSTSSPADNKKGGGGKKDDPPNLIYLAIMAGLAVYLLR
ncbi:MAG: hypothetical protein RLZZ597_1715 [Cyanobacteriota bacterium]|jgi:hypothetical protein